MLVFFWPKEFNLGGITIFGDCRQSKLCSADHQRSSKVITASLVFLSRPYKGSDTAFLVGMKL
jgi:hypothetical protein